MGINDLKINEFYFTQSIPENSGLTEEMSCQMNLEGVVNSHAFTMEGIGGGNILT